MVFFSKSCGACGMGGMGWDGVWDGVGYGVGWGWMGVGWDGACGMGHVGWGVGWGVGWDGTGCDGMGWDGMRSSRGGVQLACGAIEWKMPSRMIGRMKVTKPRDPGRSSSREIRTSAAASPARAVEKASRACATPPHGAITPRAPLQGSHRSPVQGCAHHQPTEEAHACGGSSTSSQVISSDGHVAHLAHVVRVLVEGCPKCDDVLES
jgi:hypothetical protein